MPVITLDEGPGSAASPENYNQQSVQPSAVDINYFKTPPGIVKLAQMIFGIVTIAVSPPFWLSIVASLGLTGTFFWFWIYFFQMNRKYAINPPWIILEFYYTGAAFLAYAVMVLITFLTLHWISAVFGLFTAICYGIGSFFLLPEFKVVRQSQSPIST